MRSTSCVHSAAWRTKSGTSPIPRTPSSSRASAATTRTRTRAGGSATPGSPFWFRACRAGARSACSKSTISAIRQDRRRFATSACRVMNPVLPAPCRRTCMVRSRPGRRAIASTSPTVRSTAASSRLSIARSCCRGRRRPPRRICAIRRSAGSTCRRFTARTRPFHCCRCRWPNSRSRGSGRCAISS